MNETVIVNQNEDLDKTYPELDEAEDPAEDTKVDEEDNNYKSVEN